MKALLLLAVFALSGCGVTAYQRTADRFDAARADLYSPAMTARICALGADTAECRK